MKVSIILFAVLAVAYSRPQSTGKQYPLKLQPELDSLNIEDYLRNDKILDLQIKCVVYDGPCDAVGKWVKPRIAGAIVGKCEACTPKQSKNMQKILYHIMEKRPAEFKASIEKFIRETGITIDPSKIGTPAAVVV